MTWLAASSSAHAGVPAGPPHTMNGFFAIAFCASARAATWGGLTVSYLAPRVPPSFAIIGMATATYLAAYALPW